MAKVNGAIGSSYSLRGTFRRRRRVRVARLSRLPPRLGLPGMVLPGVFEINDPAGLIFRNGPADVHLGGLAGEADPQLTLGRDRADIDRRVYNPVYICIRGDGEDRQHACPRLGCQPVALHHLRHGQTCDFPDKHSIGSRAVAWREAEVLRWLCNRGVPVGHESHDQHVPDFDEQVARAVRRAFANRNRRIDLVRKTVY